MKLFKPICASALCLSLAFSSAALCKSPALVEFTLNEDFDSGGTAGWGSYPEFEDSAYDFTLLNATERDQTYLQGAVYSGEFYFPLKLRASSGVAANKRYLLRSYRPNSASPQIIGFARKIGAWIDGESTLNFEWWLSPNLAGPTLRIDVSTRDGRRFIGRWPVEQRGWVKTQLKLSEMRDEHQETLLGREMDGLAIMIETDAGDPSAYVFFAIDNLTLSGRRQAGFRIASPQSSRADLWAFHYLTQHYYPNDTLALELEPVLPIEVGEYQIARATDAQPICQGTLELSHENKWRLNPEPTFTADSPAGPLELRVTGRTKNGSLIEDRIRLWLMHQKPAGHPRLLFAAKDKQALLDRRQTARGGALWRGLVERASAMRKTGIPEDGQIELLMKDYLLRDIDPYFRTLQDSAVAVMHNALVFYLDGDPEAGKFAREGMLRLCRWTQWVHPWFETQGRRSYYPVGIVAQQLAIAYDLMHAELSEDERLVIRNGIMEKAVIPAHHEYFTDNRIPTNTSNWISHMTAGTLMPLLAFQGELDADAKGADIEPYFSQLADKCFAHLKDTLLDDGSYGEGFSYQDFTYETAGPLFAALEHAAGIKDLAGTFSFADSWRYLAYVSSTDGRSLIDMGDSHDERHASHNWAWFVTHFQNDGMKWLYDAYPGTEWQDFIWHREPADIAVNRQELPPSRIFEKKGNAVFRSGWGDQDALLLFRAGPNFNHTHFDQGSFRLRAYGEDLITEARLTDYYEDPYYWSYFIQAAGHNTLLIDDDPESQLSGDYVDYLVGFKNRAAIIHSMLGNGVSMLDAELGDVYQAPLTSYRRRLVFLDPGYVVVQDMIESREPHEYQFQLHPPRIEKVQIDENHATFPGEHAALDVLVSRPESSSIKLKETPISYRDYQKYPARPLKPRGVVQIKTREAMRDAEFLVALTPYAATTKPALPTRYEVNGAHGFEYLLDDKLQRVIFGDRTGLQDDVLSSDAGVAHYSLSNGKVDSVSLCGATRLRINRTHMILGEQAFSVSLEIEGRLERWRIQSKTDNRLDIDCMGPAEVRSLVGCRLIEKSDAKLVLELKAGDSSLEIVY